MVRPEAKRVGGRRVVGGSRFGAVAWAAGAVAAGLVGGASRAGAAEAVWNGGGGDDNWSTGANWVGGVAPVAADALTFDGATRLTPVNDIAAGTAFDGIGFAAGAGSFVLGGNGIVLGGDVVVRSTNAQVINFGLELNAPRTLSVIAGAVPNGGRLTVNGVISDGGAGHGLTLASNALERVQTGSGGVITLGTVALTRANTYTGATEVRSANLVLDFSAAGAPASDIVSASSGLVLGSTASASSGAGVGWLTVTGAAGASNSQTFAGTTVGVGANRIQINQNGATAVNVGLGALARQAGGVLTLNLPSAGSVTASAPLVNGIIGSWATVGDATATAATGPTDWATIVGGNVVPLSAVAGGYTVVTGAPNIGASSPGANVRWSSSSGNATVSGTGTTDINTFVYAEGASRTVNLAGTLRFGASGGILRPNAAATTNLNFTGAGRVTAGGADNTPGELVLNNGQQASSNNNNGTLQIGVPIQDNGTGAVTVIKAGRGSLTLSGNNSYTGNTYILEGRVSMNTATAFGGTGRSVFVEPGGQVFVNTAAPAFYNYFIAGQGSVENAGLYGAIRVNNAQTLGGTITLTGGARVGGGGVNGTITAKIGGAYDLEFGGVGDNGLTISNAANDWSGETIVNRGTLRLGNDEVIPHGTAKGGVTLNAVGGAAILDLNGREETVNTLLAAGTPASAFVQNGSAGSTATLTVGGTDASWTFGGSLRDNAGTGGVLALSKVGTGTLTLTGASTHTGVTSVRGGTLKVGSNSALSAGSVVGLGSGSAGGTLDLAGFNPKAGGLTSAGIGTNVVGNSSTSSASVLTIGGGSNATSTFGGVIRDAIGAGDQTTGLAVESGAFTLSGANTYTGATTVTGGALVVNGSLAAGSAVTVSGGALGGTGDGIATGTVGAVTVNAGGSVRPGGTAVDGDIGTLTMSSLAVNGGDLRFDLAAGGASDLVDVTGVATFGAASTLTLAPGVTSGTYTLLTAGTLAGTAPAVALAKPIRGSFTLDFDTSAARIQLTVVGGDAKALTWTGSNGSAWDAGATANWFDGTAADQYFDGDSVTLGDGPTNRAIVLNTTVSPAAMTVNNSVGNDYVISGTGGIAGATGLTKSGGGTLTLGTANTYTGATLVQEGTLVVGAAGAIPATSAVTLGSGTNGGVLDLGGRSVTVGALTTEGTGGALNVVGNSSTSTASVLTVAGGTNASTFGGVIRDALGAGNRTTGLTVAGGSLTLTGTNTYTGPTSVGGGATLVVTGSVETSSGVSVAAGGAFEAGSTQRVRALTLSGNASASVAPGERKVLVVGNNTVAAPLSMSAAAGAKLELGGNALVVETLGGSESGALTTVRNLILAGYAGGTWGGNGITSSEAAANPSARGVGYALASDVFGASGGDFMGVAVDGSTVLARFTLLGDATLDGEVDFNDLVKIAQNYNVVDGTRRWFTGDFTYDGNVDFNDLVKLAQNYNQALPDGAVPGAPAEFGADLAAAFAAVPEPGAVGLLAVAGAVMAGRRRRRG